MHIDARTLPNNSIIEADVCIVGAGAAGIAMALDWNNRTEKVVLLEGGGFEYDTEIQERFDGSSDGQRYYPLMSTRLHYFGGTTGHWSGLCTPFDAIDFESRNWVPESGWPIRLNTLTSYYDKAKKLLGLEPRAFQLAAWEKEVPNLTPFPLNSSVFYNKIWQYSKARYGTLYREAIVKSTNICLYTYANATEIFLGENKSFVQNISVKTPLGKTFRVKAKRFVLACGSIQNARLLLASNRQIATGIGNDYDKVGRYFMEHPELAAGELWLNKPFDTDLYFRRSAETRVSAEIAFSAKAQEKHSLLNGTFSLFPLGMGQFQTPRINLWQNKDPRKSKEVTASDWGAARRKSKKLQGAIEHAFKINARLEQAPNPNSRITLGREKDALGVPKAHLHWELGQLEKDSLRNMCLLLGREFGKTGLGRVRLNDFLTDPENHQFPDYTNGGWHHMGTTRMHQDPKRGVVDENCQIHGVQNLFIAGASCFATGGAANPTLTLTALTLRLSDYLKRQI
jgi:choline dehydrogenase-like flavoprotein